MSKHYVPIGTGRRSSCSDVNTSCRPDLSDDSVFAVKDKLVVNFRPVSKGYRAVESELQGKVVYELEQNFHLAKAAVRNEAEITGPLLGMSIEANGQ